MQTTNKEELICPKCGKRFKDHPAISRVDNKTAICPACGQREALEAMGMEKEEIEKIVDITNGNLPDWEI